MIELPQSAVRDYPGGYARWHADMSAKLTREGASVKSSVLGGGRLEKGQCVASTTKNAATGSVGPDRGMPGSGPNVTEQRYRDTYLVPRILTGEIVECVFEGKTFVLADGPKPEDRCEYTPDWWCRLADGSEECHEVKGAHVWGDSRIKFKWARDKFRGVRWVWGQWKNGTWKIWDRKVAV